MLIRKITLIRLKGLSKTILKGFLRKRCEVSHLSERCGRGVHRVE